ncbi:MAG: PIN domain-containing protein [Alphaproteobacteria bacterium]|nr:PIN domain-containing protein [Alphaproteobacteria bacterium]
MADALEGRGAISAQVVQEFLNVALRRFERPMSLDEARAYLDVVLAPLCLVHTSIPLVERALAVRLRWGFSWFDALVVAGAMEAGCSVLYSEDLQHGQDLDGLRVVDPFRPGV